MNKIKGFKKKIVFLKCSTTKGDFLHFSILLKLTIEKFKTEEVQKFVIEPFTLFEK